MTIRKYSASPSFTSRAFTELAVTRSATRMPNIWERIFMNDGLSVLLRKGRASADVPPSPQANFPAAMKSSSQRGFAREELHLREPAIYTARRAHELIVGATFHDRAVLHHIDAIAFPNRRETVRDENRGA